MNLQSGNEKKILHENILKALYHLGEKDGYFSKSRSIGELQSVRAFNPGRLASGLIALKKKRLINSDEHSWKLTSAGLKDAKRVVRLHRLWELYLTQRLRMPPDHVHNDAEAIEHVITPEIEKMLEQELGFPQKDPHHSDIPVSE